MRRVPGIIDQARARADGTTFDDARHEMRQLNPLTLPKRAMRRLEVTIRWERRLHDWEARRFDRKLGVETAGMVEPTELTVPAGDAREGIVYLGMQPRLARWCLSGIRSDPGMFTFVDMGSGKGRVLLLAARHGFARVVGVEFAKELHTIAVENARAARKHGLSIEPVFGDAAAFDFPPEPLVVFFNNPFHESVMKRVLANLTVSYEEHPRPLVVVYQQMKEERPGHRTRNLELLDQVPFLSGRMVPPPRRALDRRMLELFMARIFESPEVG